MRQMLQLTQPSGDHITRENVACFTGNGTHVNMVSALEKVLAKPLGVGL